MGLDMYLYAERNVDRARIPDIGAPDDEDGTYVSGWDHTNAADVAIFRALLEASELGGLKTDDSPHALVLPVNDDTVNVRLCAAYWRKANQIHAWFVSNVQDGIDECQLSPVTREQLETLRDTCIRVIEKSQLADGIVRNGQTWQAGEEGWKDNLELGKIVIDPAVAEEHLPTQGGFFFGSTDYNEWYVQDLVHTVDAITRVLASAPTDATFSYRSSW